MRVVITGATGNVGTALLDRLIPDTQVSSIMARAHEIAGGVGERP